MSSYIKPSYSIRLTQPFSDCKNIPQKLKILYIVWMLENYFFYKMYVFHEPGREHSAQFQAKLEHGLLYLVLAKHNPQCSPVL